MDRHQIAASRIQVRILNYGQWHVEPSKPKPVYKLAKRPSVLPALWAVAWALVVKS
jgi:hypothetical protein